MPEPKAAVAGLVRGAGGSTLLASGLFADGSATGLLASGDGGSGWQPTGWNEQGTALLSLSTTALDPALIAGLAPRPRLSRDGGATFNELSAAPEDVCSLALSATVPGRVYAGSRGGMWVSDDLGETWRQAYPGTAPVTAVASLSDGRVAAFVYGVGVVAAAEDKLDWQTLAGGFRLVFLAGLVEQPDNGDLLALADTGAVLVSRDGGANWIAFEGSAARTAETLQLGQVTYEDNCQACHGALGVGEAPDDPEARDEFGFKAPALDDSMHAWHHSDANLKTVIREGSDRNERMIAWQEQLSADEIAAVVTYIKSLWGVDALACQGARHMGCLQRAQ